jgi:hypothetical protein
MELAILAMIASGEGWTISRKRSRRLPTMSADWFDRPVTSQAWLFMKVSFTPR